MLHLRFNLLQSSSEIVLDQRTSAQDVGVKMRFLSVLAIRTDFSSGCSGHKKANLRRADVSYFLQMLLTEKEIGDVYGKAT